MSRAEKIGALEQRKRRKQPFHALPHFSDGCPGIYFITGTIYYHHPIIGYCEERMSGFRNDLLQSVQEPNFKMYAYCILPNHYHLLAEGDDPEKLRSSLGKLHGRSSREWNKIENTVGRKVWYRVFDKVITSDRQFYTKLNYIHFNPVKAGLCKKTIDWEYSSAREFVENHGRDNAVQIWKNYPPE